MHLFNLSLNKANFYRTMHRVNEGKSKKLLDLCDLFVIIIWWVSNCHCLQLANCIYEKFPVWQDVSDKQKGNSFYCTWKDLIWL